MRIWLIACTLLLAVIFSDAGQRSTLGKLLARRFPELSENDQSLILVSLKDKGNIRGYQTQNARNFVSEKSLRRRLKTRQPNALISEDDYPLHQPYVDAVGKHVVLLRHQLKWFNAVSAIATKRQIREIQTLPFVNKIELVGQWRKNQDDEKELSESKQETLPSPEGTTSLDYGASFTQLNQINVPALHDLGIYGQGVVVGVFDNGFRLLNHEAFASMNIIAQHDFVDHKTSVIPNNPSGGFGAHGVNTLSTIGGYKPGQLIGPAFKSSFILARTENDSSETPIEEDNWVKAIEWADSIGVDVTSTSLGYLTYNSPYTSWTWRDMDGSTTLITQAADHAVALGIVVVNSAGNDALARAGDPNTLIAPADGFDVITAGAVNSAGTRAAFSSFGPTFDGRIKPDVMAMGVNVRVASSSQTTGYLNVNGTSFSCPLTAGVAALLVCANPSLAPADIADALRQTANNSSSPDNFYGWGVVDALGALQYNAIMPLAKVSGRIYEDINGDGIIEAGEIGAAGVKVLLAGTMAESTYTNSSGDFEFASLAIGTYSLHQVTTPGWEQTYPSSGYTFSLLHGADTSGFSFATFKPGNIHGVVFNDSSGNGIRDIGDPGLSGWRLRLFGPETLSVTTGVNGVFDLTNIKGGTYSLSESSFTGWLQTIPTANGSYMITVRSGLDTTGLEFGNTYSPMFSYHVIDGWNLLSLPNGMSDMRKSILYPTATTNAFLYAGSYRTTDSLSNGTGYWLKFAHAQNVLLPGTLRILDTIDVKKGWNMIGGLSSTSAVSSVEQIPPNNIVSSFYSYNGSYHTADSLRPHDGYWIKVNTDGKFALLSSPSNLTSGIIAHGMPDRSDLDQIIIEDAHGNKQTLYLVNGHTALDLSLSEVPPIPPGDGFDARFASQRFIENLLPGKNLPIDISGGTYPMAIRYDFQHTSAMMDVSGAIVALEGKGEFPLLKPASGITLQASSKPNAGSFPDHYSLDQNYPNPFNPTTNFSFVISARGGSFVSLKIYDVLGREVATIVDEMKEPGSYTVTWDASAYSSGMYFCKMKAGAFVEVRKLVLAR